MPTFIDESGDTGWKPGSHPFFRLGAVWLPTQEEVEACRETIRTLRAELGLRKDFEFKFARTGSHSDRRQAFFRAVIQHDFRFVVCAYDKHRITPAGSVEAAEFHWGCAVTLASYLRDTYRRAEALKGKAGGKPCTLQELVVVDDNGDREFLATVKEAFRGLASGWRDGGKLVGKVKFRDSEPDEMLQLVDMIVGAVGAQLEGDSTWFKLISGQCLGVVCLP